MPEQEEAPEAEAEEQEQEDSPVFDDPEYLREKYHDEGLTQAQIGEEHDVTASTISHYMNKHGIETRANQVDDERLEDAEWLEEQYVDEDRTMQDIADEVGCSDGTVMRRLRKFGIIEEPDDDDGAEAEADDSDKAEATEE